MSDDKLKNAVSNLMQTNVLLLNQLHKAVLGDAASSPAGTVPGGPVGGPVGGPIGGPIGSGGQLGDGTANIVIEDDPVEGNWSTIGTVDGWQGMTGFTAERLRLTTPSAYETTAAYSAKTIKFERTPAVARDPISTALYQSQLATTFPPPPVNNRWTFFIGEDVVLDPNNPLKTGPAGAPPGSTRREFWKIVVAASNPTNQNQTPDAILYRDITLSDATQGYFTGWFQDQFYFSPGYSTKLTDLSNNIYIIRQQALNHNFVSVNWVYNRFSYRWLPYA